MAPFLDVHFCSHLKLDWFIVFTLFGFSANVISLPALVAFHNSPLSGIYLFSSVRVMKGASQPIQKSPTKGSDASFKKRLFVNFENISISHDISPAICWNARWTSAHVRGHCQAWWRRPQCSAAQVCFPLCLVWGTEMLLWGILEHKCFGLRNPNVGLRSKNVAGRTSTSVRKPSCSWQWCQSTPFWWPSKRGWWENQN